LDLGVRVNEQKLGREKSKNKVAVIKRENVKFVMSRHNRVAVKPEQK
jgi:hypothetical protein